MLAAAAAQSQVQVVLDPLRGRLGDLQLLERAGHAQILRVGQVTPARAPPLRVVIARVIRLGPAHRRSRRPRLLAALALGRALGGAPLLTRGLRPGPSSPEGGIEEFWLLRDKARSSRATRARSSATSAARARSSANSASRAAQLAQLGAGAGRSGTSHDHPESADSKHGNTPSRPPKIMRPPTHAVTLRQRNQPPRRGW